MDDKLTEVLKRLAPKPPRSRLDAHVELIEELLKQGRTYKEIAHALAEAGIVRSSPSNLFHFVKTRERRAKLAKVKQQRGKKERADIAKASPPTWRSNKPLAVRQSGAGQRITTAQTNQLKGAAEDIDFDYDPTRPLTLIDPGKQAVKD
jgi:hypothetical protein